MDDHLLEVCCHTVDFNARDCDFGDVNGYLYFLHIDFNGYHDLNHDHDCFNANDFSACDGNRCRHYYFAHRDIIGYHYYCLDSIGFTSNKTIDSDSDGGSFVEGRTWEAIVAAAVISIGIAITGGVASFAGFGR